jgi:hypothetical protein
MSMIVVGPNAFPPYNTDGVDDHVQINAAIAALSSGDAVYLDGKLFLITAALVPKDGVDVYAIGKFSTTVRSAGIATNGYMCQASLIDNIILRRMTLDCNWQGGGGTQVGGVFLGKSGGHLIEDVFIKETDGPKVSFASVTNTALNNITTRNTKGATGISHGIDIDHATDVLTDCDGITLNDCDLEDADRDSTKVENGVNIVYNRCVFRGRTLFGEAVASNVGVILNDCIHDGRVVVAARNAGPDIEFNRSIFTHDGGVLQVDSQAGAGIVLTDPQFYGRNTYYGWNGVTWVSPTSVSVVGALRHYNKPGNGGKTMFADPGNTHADAGVIPYATPHTAHASLEAIVENANLDEANMNYALVAGDYVWAAGAIQVQAGTGLTVESYGGRSTIDLNGGSTDFINFGSGGRVIGGVLEGFHIKGGRGGFNGTGISLVGTGIGTETSLRLIGCEVSDMVSAAGGYGQALYASGDGWVLDFGGLYCHDITGDSAGGAIRCQNAGTITGQGPRLHDITSPGGAMRITSSVTSWAMHGVEVVRCNGVGGTAGLALEKPGALSQATFKDNVGADMASGANAVTVNNSILPDYAQWTGTAKTANYNLIGTGSPGGTNIAGVPIYEDAANDDYRLTDASPGRKAGNKWWVATGPRPLGSDGRPFPDRLIDIGSRQRIEA